MTSLEDVELRFICNEKIYTAKARVTGVNKSIGPCVIDNIHDYSYRPLRGENRIDVHLPCSVVVRDDRDTRRIVVDKRQSQNSNLSCTGTLLSTRIFRKTGSNRLLLFALDARLELKPSSNHMYIRERLCENKQTVIVLSLTIMTFISAILIPFLSIYSKLFWNTKTKTLRRTNNCGLILLHHCYRFPTIIHASVSQITLPGYTHSESIH